jgi:hypothetical protein
MLLYPLFSYIRHSHGVWLAVNEVIFINFIKNSSWDASSFPADQEIPSLLWNSKIRYRVYKSQPLVSMLTQMYPVHTFILHP